MNATRPRHFDNFNLVQASQKTVLIIDDDPLYVDIVAQGLRLAFPEFVILSIDNGGEALAIIDDRGLNLVITDLCMPEVDGLDVLLKLKEKGPAIPTIVLTGVGATKADDIVRDFGTRLFLKKPVDFDVLSEGVRNILGSEPDVPTTASGSRVVSFLRLMELYHKSGTLQILSNERRGELHFEKGILTHARTDTWTGSPALLEILGWHSPEVRISRQPCTAAPNIWEPWSSFVFESNPPHTDIEKPQGETGGAN